MTVLAKYQRLEAEGLWRPTPDAQRRDVIVAIGDATLTISAPNGDILSHWSLPAILRLNPGETPALFTPGDDLPETLELSDPEMTAGIDAVLKAIQRGGARPGRVRGAGQLVTVAALSLIGFIWLPGAITRYTASLVPEGARSEISQRMMAEIRRVTGAPCADPAGLRALGKLETRLFADGRTRLTVLSSALTETAHLPGGIILVSHNVVEDHETPEVLAGYILAENLRRQARDPLERLLSDAGLGAALRLLTTGNLADETLRLHAERVVAADPAQVPDAALIATMQANGVPTAPYAFARDISGESTLPLIEASQNGSYSAPILGDGDWIALQRICEG